jgi:hypothetical protein
MSGTNPSPPRYRSEEEWQAAIERRAIEIWNEREAKMPTRAQQAWEQGSWAARRATLAMARVDLTERK